MTWGLSVWTMLYGGGALLVWAGAGGTAALTFLAGLAFAVVTVMLADWITREKPNNQRSIFDVDAD